MAGGHVRYSLVPNKLEPVRLALTAVKGAGGRGNRHQLFEFKAPEFYRS